MKTTTVLLTLAIFLLGAVVGAVGGEYHGQATIYARVMGNVTSEIASAVMPMPELSTTRRTK